MTDPGYDVINHVDKPYCDYCEREGHTFRTCPARDDIFNDEP